VARGRAGTALAFGLIALVAGGIVLYATSIGPWAFSDGAGYIMLARNVIAGRGLGLVRASGHFQPLSMHPPLYPLSIAGLAITGEDLLEATRWFNAVLFSVTTILIGWTVYWVSDKRWIGFAAASVAAVSTLLLELYSGAMSEPLFIATGFGSLLLLLVYFRMQRRGVLVASAVLAGLCLLTRYAGAAFIAAGTLGLLILEQAKWRRRALDAGTFVLVSGSPSVAWLVWSSRQPGVVAPRQWLWDLGGLWERTEPIRGGLVEALWSWVPLLDRLGAMAYRSKLAILVFLGSIFAGILVIAIRKMRLSATPRLDREPTLQLLAMLSMLVAAYLTLVTATFLFSSPPDVDQRILLPVYLFMILGFFAIVDVGLRAWDGNRSIRVLAIAVTLVAIGWSVPRSWSSASWLHAEGAGYTSLEWQRSETIVAVADLRADIPLITNDSTAVSYHLDRPAYDIPELLYGAPLSNYARFGDGDSGEDRIFRRDGAALVLFDSAYWQFREIYGDRADSRFENFLNGLEVYAQLADGGIYFYPRSDGRSD
jgi:hypothetical protein